MDGRCAFSATRKNWDQGEETPPDSETISAQKRATELFVRYRKQYPRGRFVADALGWLGALAFDAGNYVDALDCYIAQAETPGHPETLKSAVFMCERSLAAVAATPEGNVAFAQIARHPRIAMGFTYLVLSAREADNYDGKFDKPVDVKKWRRTILPRIAAEVVKQKERYKDGDWQPRYLALLAQAASAEGNQAQALQLTDLAPAELERSDDLLLVRAIAFQRAGQAADAIATYRQLLDKFPRAPTAPGVRLRLAFALQDNHEAGGALAELDAPAAKHERRAAGESDEMKRRGGIARIPDRADPLTRAGMNFRRARQIGLCRKARCIQTSPAPTFSKFRRRSTRCLILRRSSNSRRLWRAPTLATLEKETYAPSSPNAIWRRRISRRRRNSCPPNSSHSWRRNWRVDRGHERISVGESGRDGAAGRRVVGGARKITARAA